MSKRKAPDSASSAGDPTRQPEEGLSSSESLKHQQLLSKLLTAGVASNTLTVLNWSQELSGEPKIDLLTIHKTMATATKRAENGEMGDAEAMLMAQALSLNAIFASLALQAHRTRHLDQLDRLMRLALKTQGQCRATVETLAVMKNPPVFAKQANIAAGPQQVNNGIVNNSVAPAEILNSVPNKLLESHEQRLDGRSTCEAEQRDSAVDALGALNRPANIGRQETGIPQRLSRR
jgi:hypothetical protein